MQETLDNKITPVISILGCGWLGLALAKALLDQGTIVKGSSTRPDKTKELSRLGIEAYTFTVGQESTLPDAFFDCDRLVITLPFRRSLTDPFDYARTLATLTPHLSQDRLDQVIFTSSTGIYPVDCGPITETAPFTPQTDRQSALLEAENVFRGLATPATICRFGGLIGPDRVPGKFMAGKSELPNPDGPVNLIWQSDCIKILLGLLNSCPEEATYNCVGDDHPSRKVFYTQAAAQQGLPTPTFGAQTLSTPKLVSGEAIKERLSLTFKPLF